MHGHLADSMDFLEDLRAVMIAHVKDITGVDARLEKTIRVGDGDGGPDGMGMEWEIKCARHFVFLRLATPV